MPLPLSGDPHNFGTRVELLSSEVIYKPRTLVWEWLFLSSESPLREHLTRLAEEAGVTNPFTTIPDLKFMSSSRSALSEGGCVQRLRLDDVSGLEIRSEEFVSIGAAIALFAWFGVTDLHIENLAFGYQKDVPGKLIFSAIDIECLFDEVFLLSQQGLLASSVLSAEHAGLSRLESFFSRCELGSCPAALCHGFLSTLSFLADNENSINSLLVAFMKGGSETVRHIIRATREYKAVLANGGVEKKRLADELSRPLFETELEQLRRGDVPYFFRYSFDRTLRYFSAPGRVSDARIPEGMLPEAMSLARTAESDWLRPRARARELSLFCALQLVRFIDSVRTEGGSFVSSYSDTTVIFAESELSLVFGAEVRVKCRSTRRLSSAPREVVHEVV